MQACAAISTQSENESYVKTVVQSVLASSHIWGPRPDFCYYETVVSFYMWGVLSKELLGLCASGSRQCSHIHPSQTKITLR